MKINKQTTKKSIKELMKRINVLNKYFGKGSAIMVKFLKLW